jgi:hypothetical protein
MTIVAAFLVHGHPLPYLQSETAAFKPLVNGYRAAAAALSVAKPDVVLAYSTQWIAVLDELWQTRPHSSGLHVDENWYEYGDLNFDITIDRDLAVACVEGSKEVGISAKAVDYDGFPIDSGSIVMANSLDPEHRLQVRVGVEQSLPRRGNYREAGGNGGPHGKRPGQTDCGRGRGRAVRINLPQSNRPTRGSNCLEGRRRDESKPAHYA